MNFGVDFNLAYFDAGDGDIWHFFQEKPLLATEKSNEPDGPLSKASTASTKNHGKSDGKMKHVNFLVQRQILFLCDSNFHNYRTCVYTSIYIYICTSIYIHIYIHIYMISYNYMYIFSMNGTWECFPTVPSTGMAQDALYPSKQGLERRINWGWAQVRPNSTQSLPRVTLDWKLGGSHPHEFKIGKVRL
jgi:hypothetical protein